MPRWLCALKYLLKYVGLRGGVGGLERASWELGAGWYLKEGHIRGVGGRRKGGERRGNLFGRKKRTGEERKGEKRRGEEKEIFRGKKNWVINK